MSEGKTPGKDPDSQVRPARRAQSAPEPALPYSLGEWGGQPQYRCKLCRWDTLSEDRMVRHQEQSHGATPTARRLTGLVDSRGRQIVISDRED